MSTLQYVKEILTDRISGYKGSDKDDKNRLDIEPYHNLQKSAVLQESRCFNESQIQDRKCRQILTKLIYLINQGEVFNENETQSLFFGATKLFQSNNADLKRMLYLLIKEFRDENSMYVVISCLTKDIISKNDLFRLNSLRTIPLVLEPSNLVQIERYLKNAVLDKSMPISSAALIAGLQIFRISPEFVRKWSNEVAERLNSKYPQNSFHALILLHEIKKNDRSTFIKVLMQLTKETLVPIANMQVIRFIKEILNDVDQGQEKLFIDYLIRQVHKSQEMVIFEAAKALCEIKSLSNKDLQPMVQVLMVFLVSNNVINKFVALKLINKLIANPIRRALITSTTQIEALIQDSNKSLSSQAVSILLKICQEQNIDKLLNQIYEYLSDMSDEFKIDILRSVKALVKNSPKKWKPIITFLQQTFKCEASQDFKRYGVEIFESIIQDIPEARESAIMALAEYIEDCQHSQIQLNVLSLLNREASRHQCPTKIIRIINNRLHLEEPEIRAAAVGVLGKFITHYPKERENVRRLVEAATNDPDEEVRNRSQYYIGADANSTIEPINTTELDAIEAYLQYNIVEIQSSVDPATLSMGRILSYAESNKGKVKKTEVVEQMVEQEIQQQETGEHEDFETYSRLFKENVHFKDYGVLRKVVSNIDLTDKKSEYLVQVVKFMFDNHIVLEYKIKNTLHNIGLLDVGAELTIKNHDLQVDCVVTAKQIDAQTSANVFVGLQFNPNQRLVASNISTILVFTVNDNATKYQDEYQVEDFNITYSDFMTQEISFKKFQPEWEKLEQECSSTFQLNYKNTDIAVKELAKHFGMCICESSDIIQPANKFHTLLLGGKYLGHVTVLVICQIGFQQNIGCILKIRAKSTDERLSNNILETLG